MHKTVMLPQNCSSEEEEETLALLLRFNEGKWTSANNNCCRHLVSSESSNIPKKYPLSSSYRKSNSPSPGGLFCANADVVVVISACGCGLHHISEHSELAGNSNFGLSNLCATGDHHHQELWEDQQYQIEEVHQQENHWQQQHGGHW